MLYIGIALLCAVIGAMPLLFKKKVALAGIIAGAAFVVLSIMFYWWTPSTVGPFFAFPGFCVFILWIISAVVDGMETDEITWASVFPILFLLYYIGGGFLGSSGMLHADQYKSLIGPFEKRVWTQDIQPKSTEHIRLVNLENAFYIAQNSISQGGNIGSQFHINKNDATLQKINGALWFIIPLDFKSFSTWYTTDETPGYIMVSAEHNHQEAKFVKFPNGQGLKYMPGAYFNYNLERHLRNKGYLNVELSDYTFEIDDQGHAYWIVTVSKPSIFNDGFKVSGVVQVDPATGEDKFFPLGNVPDWIDRVMPENFVQSYIAYWGEYIHGYWNSWFGKKDVDVPDETNLIYGADGEPYWVTGVKAKGKATSLVALFYVNSRTGKAVYYETNGGSTDEAVKAAINKNSQVKYLGLHAADPQLYNIKGTMADIALVLNDNYAVQGVAIVNIHDIQNVAFGKDLYEAWRAYQDLLGNKQQIALEKDTELKEIVGIVDRSQPDYLSTGTVRYIHIKGVSRLFMGGFRISPKLSVTEAGDKVRIKYYDSSDDVITMKQFDNLSLPLTQSKPQVELNKAEVERKDQEILGHEADTVREKVKDLSPEQLKEVGKLLKKK